MFGVSLISEFSMISGDMQWRLVWYCAVALVFFWVIQRIRKWLRRRRPPKIHPKLQKYQPTEGDFTANRRAESAKIIATSSGSELIGYRVVRQVEAVFVDGFRRPEEAVEGLKAVAGMKGANALLHVRHEPIGSGRYAASGDAVIVESAESASAAPKEFGGNTSADSMPVVKEKEDDPKPSVDDGNTDSTLNP